MKRNAKDFLLEMDEFPDQEYIDEQEYDTSDKVERTLEEWDRMSRNADHIQDKSNRKWVQLELPCCKVA